MIILKHLIRQHTNEKINEKDLFYKRGTRDTNYVFGFAVVKIDFDIIEFERIDFS